MVRYRRNLIEGGAFFFTVTLADRRSMALVEHIDALREAFRTARSELPFAIEAIVILPDHLHAILTLPEGNADFPGRWRRIKGHFSSRLIADGVPIKRHANGELALWQRRYWSTPSVTTAILPGMPITFISTRSGMGWYRACGIGRIRRFIPM